MTTADLQFTAAEFANESLLRCRRAGAAQADELMAAGWSFELPEIVNRKSVRHKLNPQNLGSGIGERHQNE